MDSTLNVTVKILSFSDVPVSSNPRLRTTDWTRDISGTSVSNPKTESYRITPLATKDIFSGVVPTSIDGTTAFDVSFLEIADTGRYRFQYVSGTAPAFRTPRSVVSIGVNITTSTAINGTMTVTAATAIFGAVQAGDEVLIPHTSTGDAANVFSPINAGTWQVLGVNSTSEIVLMRPSGEDFVAISESVTPTANSQLQIFSADGVQVGNTVDITAGFSPSAQKSFEVVAVTDSFIEVVSTSPIAEEVGIIPGAAGMVFYDATKEFLYIEASQECVVRVNGDTGNSQRLSPVDASDSTKPGSYLRRGPTWSLTIVNRSTSPLDVTIIHAE